MQRAAIGLSVAVALLVAPAALAQSPAPLEANPFGFSCDNQTTYSLASYCEKMARAGIGWIRGFPTANVIAPERGRYDWSSVETLLGTAEANGMAVSGILFYMPEWIEAGEARLPVGDLAGWAEYVSAVVTHCKGRVRYWEVWNETPNFIGSATAEDYAKTVVASYEAAKAADPDCQVGLSIQSNNVHWTTEVLRAGARGHYDYIAVHPYETLGLVEASGLEATFLAIVPTLRTMLAVEDPARAEAPIWFTEIGMDAREGEVAQAGALVKAYAMALAQGVARIDWFEGIDGDSGPMGLLRADGSPRLAYAAMAHLTRLLGPTPRYEGWLQPGGSSCGFVFSGASEPVLALWGRPGTATDVAFPGPVRIVDPLTGATETTALCRLSATPLLVTGVPSDLLAEARANRDRPFPWPGDRDYTDATAVWLAAGAPNEERGLHQVTPDAPSTPTVAYGVAARDCGTGPAQTFTVDPGFLSYTAEPIAITVVVRRNANDAEAGFNLWYESAGGYRNTGSWYTIPGNDQWYTQTWVIEDPQFVGKWGYHFALNADSPRSYLLRSVTVSKLR